jgi:hypothetical protein
MRRELSFQEGADRYALVPRAALVLRRDAYREATPVSPAFARHVLERYFHDDTSSRRALRALHAELGASPGPWFQDRQVLTALLHDLEGLGRLVLLRWPYRPPTYAPVAEKAEPAPLQPLSEQEAPTHWVGLELKDDAGEPLAGQAYELELPDGSVRRGKLDANGAARVTGLPTRGTCRVRFPALDGELQRA